jgi:hypothetical protein
MEGRASSEAKDLSWVGLEESSSGAAFEGGFRLLVLVLPPFCLFKRTFTTSSVTISRLLGPCFSLHPCEYLAKWQVVGGGMCRSVKGKKGMEQKASTAEGSAQKKMD